MPAHILSSFGYKLRHQEGLTQSYTQFFATVLLLLCGIGALCSFPYTECEVPTKQLQWEQLFKLECLLTKLAYYNQTEPRKQLPHPKLQNADKLLFSVGRTAMAFLALAVFLQIVRKFQQSMESKHRLNTIVKMANQLVVCYITNVENGKQAVADLAEMLAFEAQSFSIIPAKVYILQQVVRAIHCLALYGCITVLNWMAGAPAGGIITQALDALIEMWPWSLDAFSKRFSTAFPDTPLFCNVKTYPDAANVHENVVRCTSLSIQFIAGAIILDIIVFSLFIVLNLLEATCTTVSLALSVCVLPYLRKFRLGRKIAAWLARRWLSPYLSRVLRKPDVNVTLQEIDPCIREKLLAELEKLSKLSANQTTSNGGFSQNNGTIYSNLDELELHVE